MPVRGLVEGALLAALTAVLALIGIFILPLSLVTSLVWTTPIVVAIVRHGWQSGTLALAVATLIIAMIAGIPNALLLLLQFGGLAVVYGIAFRHRWPMLRAIAAGTGMTVVSTVAFIWAGMVLAGLSLATLEAQFSNMFNEAVEFYRSSGLLALYGQQGISEEMLRSQYTVMVSLIKTLAPSILVIYSGVTAVTTLFVSRLIVKKLSLPIVKITPYREWRLPWYTVWGFIAGLAAALAGDYWQIENLATTGMNIINIYFPVLLVLGGAVITSFFHHFAVPALFKWLVIFMAMLFFNITVFMVAGIGLFDLVFNYRVMLEKTRRS
ncbi:MAG: DUF2232 domain-containing protein [Heliobacteriaceae bacterium]|nr:DUF2232 domain-containing protein [Heliobacteriaceae bacterium]MDD4588246.1 DUF2232 domain-containing protein [Heliobacteriaceae bacterium]